MLDEPVDRIYEAAFVDVKKNPLPLQERVFL